MSEEIGAWVNGKLDAEASPRTCTTCMHLSFAYTCNGRCCVIDRDVVSIRSGFMQFGASGLTTKGKDVDGQVFVTIGRKAWKMKDDNWEMVDDLQRLRNTIVLNLMKEHLVQLDPMANEAMMDISNKKKERFSTKFLVLWI